MSLPFFPQDRQDANGNTASESHNPFSQNSERRTSSRRNSNNRPGIPGRDSSLSRWDWIGGLCAGSHLIQLLLFFLGFLFCLIVDTGPPSGRSGVSVFGICCCFTCYGFGSVRLHWGSGWVSVKALYWECLNALLFNRNGCIFYL